jgi:hypothetical protein
MSQTRSHLKIALSKKRQIYEHFSAIEQHLQDGKRLPSRPNVLKRNNEHLYVGPLVEAEKVNEASVTLESISSASRSQRQRISFSSDKKGASAPTETLGQLLQEISNAVRDS